VPGVNKSARAPTGPVFREPSHVGDLKAAVRRLDRAIDRYAEAHFRGRPILDRLMYGASALGDHSAVWLVLAAIQGQRLRRGWRPLFEVGIALAVESVLVNGPVKVLFGRRRPLVAAPHPFYLRRVSTTSFPSGHATAAFVAAATLRDDPMWPVYYSLALMVASSRVHVRVHHASDVVAGCVFGIVLGELSRYVIRSAGRRSEDVTLTSVQPFDICLATRDVIRTRCP
jgi:undecaprenyl-diphosphatase